MRIIGACPPLLRDAALTKNRNVKRRLRRFDSAAAAPGRARGLKALSQYILCTDTIIPLCPGYEIHHVCRNRST